MVSNGCPNQFHFDQEHFNYWLEIYFNIVTCLVVSYHLVYNISLCIHHYCDKLFNEFSMVKHDANMTYMYDMYWGIMDMLLHIEDLELWERNGISVSQMTTDMFQL